MDLIISIGVSNRLLIWLMVPWYDNWASMVVTHQYFTSNNKSVTILGFEACPAATWTKFTKSAEMVVGSMRTIAITDAVTNTCTATCTPSALLICVLCHLKQLLILLLSISPGFSPSWGLPTVWSSWYGSWSRAGPWESWPSPSPEAGDPHSPPAAPRRSSAAAGGGAAGGRPATEEELARDREERQGGVNNYLE